MDRAASRLPSVPACPGEPSSTRTRTARLLPCSPSTSLKPPHSVNLCTKILDFPKFDSSRISISRGGILMSIGSSPEVSSRQIFVRIILVGRLGVTPRPLQPHDLNPREYRDRKGGLVVSGSTRVAAGPVGVSLTHGNPVQIRSNKRTPFGVFNKTNKK